MQEKVLSVMKGYINSFKPIFSDPQFENFRLITFGLIAFESKTVNGIIEFYGGVKDQSNLNRFLTRPAWSLLKFKTTYWAMLKSFLDPTKITFVAIDDSLSPKTGRRMEGVGLHYDHKKKEWILSHSFVSLYIMNGDFGAPFVIDMYKKKETTKAFRTKIEIALEQITYLLSSGIENVIFLIDSWYSSQRLIKMIMTNKKAGWIAKLKSNRVVFSNRVKMHLKTVAAHLSKSDFKKVEVKEKVYYAKSFKFELRNIGLVKVVISTEDFKNFEFFATNLMGLSDEEIINYYSKRWGIETFHKDAKQNLGLAKYQLRSEIGVIIHWHLVAAAYTLLALIKTLCPEVVSKTKATIGKVCRWIKKNFEEIKSFFIIPTRKTYERVFRMLGIKSVEYG